MYFGTNVHPDRSSSDLLYESGNLPDCLPAWRKERLYQLSDLYASWCGLPVFSGYTGGIAKLAGPTGGYLVGFILLALISGIVLEKTNRNIVWSFVGMVAGTAIAYLFGTVWFVIQAQCTVGYALSVCVMPFIPFDLLKMVIAIALGKVVFIALKRSSLLPA